MPLVCYTPKRFGKPSQNKIDAANTIIENYTAQGFKLTLRQLYYQFVARDLLKNTMKEYKNLGKVINDARLAGQIDWHAIEDRTRNLKGLSTWTEPGSIIDSAAYGYREDLWTNQDYHVEVWIEKEALAGVFERVCNQHRVDFFCCRGYTSQSEMWDAAQRLIGIAQTGKTPVILHFGDHDPSGIDMTRDIEDRLQLFCEYEGVSVETRRLALNMDQVRQYNPPPNPAKSSDARWAAYFTRFGRSSWELDALEPQVLAQLVTNEIDALVDHTRWAEDLAKEVANRDGLKVAARRWNDVQKYLQSA